VLLPNRAEAIIHVSKLRDYLLDVDHPEGSSKARLLIRIGFRRDNWEELEGAIRLLIEDNEAVEVF
jgi:hypothetical protein